MKFYPDFSQRCARRLIESNLSIQRSICTELEEEGWWMFRQLRETHGDCYERDFDPVDVILQNAEESKNEEDGLYSCLMEEMVNWTLFFPDEFQAKIQENFSKFNLRMLGHEELLFLVQFLKGKEPAFEKALIRSVGYGIELDDLEELSASEHLDAKECIQNLYSLLLDSASQKASEWAQEGVI